MRIGKTLLVIAVALGAGFAQVVLPVSAATITTPAEGLDAARSGETLSLVSTITVIGGSVLAAGGIALFVVGSKRAAKTAVAAEASGSTILGRTTLTPAVTPESGALVLRGHF